MKKIVLVMLLMVAVGSGISARDNEAARLRSYSDVQGWFVQAQGGMSLSMNDDFDLIPAGRKSNYSCSFALGKRFTTLLGIRGHFLYGSDYGFYEPEKANSLRYSFDHLGTFLEFTLNVTNLFRNLKVGEERPWNMTLAVGPGVINSFNFDKRSYGGEAPMPATITQTACGFFAGLDSSWRIFSHLELNVEMSTNWQTDNYDGMERGAFMEGAVNLMAGLRFVF